MQQIDHLFPRHNPNRHDKSDGKTCRTVLSCWKCNNDRDRRECALLPKQWFYDHGLSQSLTMRPIEELLEKEQLLSNWIPKSNKKRKEKERNLGFIREAIKIMKEKCDMLDKIIS